MYRHNGPILPYFVIGQFSGLHCAKRLGIPKCALSFSLSVVLMHSSTTHGGRIRPFLHFVRVLGYSLSKEIKLMRKKMMLQLQRLPQQILILKCETFGAQLVHAIKPTILTTL